MADTDLNPETIRANLSRARERRDQAYTEYEAAVRELAWWAEGARMFGIEDDSADALLRELLPEGASTTQPSLRQAVMLVMRASPDEAWSVADIVDALALNGWKPQKSDATKRVSDIASVMVSDGHLIRSGRGVYQLAEPLAAALVKTLPPITDYRVAAAHGRPVPDQPAASEGLSDE